MTAKRKKIKDSGSAELGSDQRPATGKRGRPRSERSRKYSWYREVEGFQTRAADSDKVWWETINWVENRKADKASRSFKAPPAELKRVLPGFFWESVRRHPGMKDLLQGWHRINSGPPEGTNLCDGGLSIGEGIVKANAEYTVPSIMVLNEIGMNTWDALNVLYKNWRLDYESLGQDARATWLNTHQDLWHWLGKRGTVPAMPVDIPTEEGPDIGKFFGQGITAYDLLIGTKGGGREPAVDFIKHPCPHVFLEQYTIRSMPEDFLQIKDETIHSLTNRFYNLFTCYLVA